MTAHDIGYTLRSPTQNIEWGFLICASSQTSTLENGLRTRRMAKEQTRARSKGSQQLPHELSVRLAGAGG
jgi:hypothetical protein